MVLGEDGKNGQDGDSFECSMNNTLGDSTMAIQGKPFVCIAMTRISDVLEAFGGLVFNTCYNDALGAGVGIDVEREKRFDTFEFQREVEADRASGR